MLTDSDSLPADASSGAHFPFKRNGRPIVIMGTSGGGSVGPVIASLLCFMALLCINIRTFWSHSLRSVSFALRDESVALRVCDIPACAGWFFQRLWPPVARVLSELLPAAFLLPLALYGFCARHSSTATHRNCNDIQMSPVSNDTRPAIMVLELSWHCKGGTERQPVPNEIAIDASPAISSSHEQRQCRADVESFECIRVMMVLALLTSVGTLQRGLMGLAAATSHISGALKGSSREWLLMLIFSHTVSLFVQCATLPLCLIFSARYRRGFCALFCSYLRPVAHTD